MKFCIYIDGELTSECGNAVEGRSDYCATHARELRKRETYEVKKKIRADYAIWKAKERAKEPRKAPKKVSDKKKANPDKHKQLYWKYFGYSEGEFIPCEVCGKESVDIHHIDARGMGGDPQKKKEVIENLQALCRECHVNYGDKEQFKNMLFMAHRVKMYPEQLIQIII
jgi:5-methylcytosine-specific restriction endonuclease McrA